MKPAIITEEERRLISRRTKAALGRDGTEAPRPGRVGYSTLTLTSNFLASPPEKITVPLNVSVPVKSGLGS